MSLNPYLYFDGQCEEAFKFYEKCLGTVFAGSEAVIEHVGSTAVPGLGAKPVIDVMVGVSRLAEADARTAFPVLRFTMEDQIAEGDKVVHRLKAEGTHQGEFLGIPPTNRRITVAGVTINRFVDGKVVEAWGFLDMLGLMQQLGALPPPMSATA